MDPNQQLDTPQFYPNPMPNPQVPNGTQSGKGSKEGPRKLKKQALLVVAATGTIILLLLIVIVIMAGNNKPAVVQKQSEVDTSEVKPATNIDIEAINNGISQDVGSLNNSEDFPATKLEDKALGL